VSSVTIDRSRRRLGAAALLGFAVRKPGEYGRSRKSPLFPETPAGQLALLGARPDSVWWNLQKPGNLLQGEHLVDDLGSAGEFDSTNGKRTGDGEPVAKKLADQGLFTTPGRVGQAVKGGRLIPRQPHE
jgi:hypothetical protein